MRITVLGHFYAMPENRIKWQRFAELFPGSDVTLLVPDRLERTRYGASIEYVVRSEDYKNYHLIALRQTCRMRGLYLESGYVLRRTRPDVFVILEEIQNWITVQALLWRRIWIPKTPALGATTQNIPTALTRPHHIWRERYVLHNVDAMNAISEEPARLLRAKEFAKPILIQEGTGADERTWYPDRKLTLAERQHRGLQGFVIGYVGALIEEKGLLDLVVAASHLRGAWRLFWVGDGSLRPRIECLAQELGVRERLHLVGYVPRGETPIFYRCMDVLVLPSHTTPTWREQFGVVLVEAMLSGVAVVGSDSGAIPEVIGDAGLIFPEGDVAALAACLQCLHDNPDLRRELAERGRQRALARYSTSAMAEESHRFFQALLKDKQGMSQQYPDVPQSDNG